MHTPSADHHLTARYTAQQRQGVIGQLKAVLAPLKSGDLAGTSHDDDFGYQFEIQSASPGPSFFDAPTGDN